MFLESDDDPSYSLHVAKLECEGLEYAGNFAASVRNIFFATSIVLFAISVVSWIAALCVVNSGDTSFWLFISSIAFFGASFLSIVVSLFSHSKMVKFERRQALICEEMVSLECAIFLRNQTPN